MDQIDLIEDEINAIKTKPAHSRKVSKSKKIRVRGSVEVAKDNYKAAKRIHKAQIKKLRANIKSHKLMIKQARTGYRLVKLADKK